MVKHVVISIPSPWRILRVFASQTLLQLHVVSAVICIIVLPSQYTGATPTPPHALCAVHSVKRFSIILLFPVAIFDWLVFVAISIRVVRIFAPHNHWRDMFKAFATGRGMGIIPKALLRTGQFYFL